VTRLGGGRNKSGRKPHSALSQRREGQETIGRTVRDDPLNPDPGFADLYAALPDADDLWPWLEWCQRAKAPVLYLGIGAGRLAVPLHQAGIELVGVDAHPGMLQRLRERIPGLELHQGLIATLNLRRTFDLVIGPSSILAADENLAAAARHARPGGRVGMELMNPHWLEHGDHRGVRVSGEAMEVDYRLPDGSVVTQLVDRIEAVAPEMVELRLEGHGLELEWMGGRPDEDLAESPTYFVLGARVQARQLSARAAPGDVHMD
jgi:hypothetical protein